MTVTERGSRRKTGERKCGKKSHTKRDMVLVVRNGHRWQREMGTGWTRMKACPWKQKCCSRAHLQLKFHFYSTVVSQSRATNCHNPKRAQAKHVNNNCNWLRFCAAVCIYTVYKHQAQTAPWTTQKWMFVNEKRQHLDVFHVLKWCPY